MQTGNAGLSRDDLAIKITPDKEARTLTVSDKGCGMTREELEENLGTIAKSGSLAFKQEHDLGEDVDIIGQFGVGFYSAFMVSKKIVVVSRSVEGDSAFRWESDGADGYTIEDAQKEEHGTEITLYIKDNTDDENYDEYLETYSLRNLVRKYSDYIRYPITMDVEKSRDWEEGEEKDDKEYATYIETETLNSMVPVWKKTKAELAEHEYEDFYKNKFNDYEDPARCIHQNVEGVATYTALILFLILLQNNGNKKTSDYKYIGCFCQLERKMGIEPTPSAWEAEVLPLNYSRVFFIIIFLLKRYVKRNFLYSFKHHPVTVVI